MKNFLTALAMFLGVASMATIGTSPAHAEAGAAGFPKVIRGDQLQFGALTVDLFGIRAPEPGTICNADGVRFECGAAATQALKRIIDKYAVSCQQVSDAQLFPMLTECKLGKTDINRLILRAGWALVDMNSCDGNPECRTYLQDQAYAKKHGNGMWLGTPPSTLVEKTNASKTDPQQTPAHPFQINLAAESASLTAQKQQAKPTLISLLSLN